MTLILSLANDCYTIQLSDRRLTDLDPSAPGRILSSTANKAGVIRAADAELAYAFAGLATTEAFDAREWLKQTFLKAGEEDCEAESFVSRFAILAEMEFASNPSILALPAEQRRISVMLSGFWNTTAGLLPAGWIVTNFQRKFDTGFEQRDLSTAQAFATWRWHKTPGFGPAYGNIERIGRRRSVSLQDVNDLRTMLLQNRPVNAVIGKALKVFFSASFSIAAAGTVGRAVSIVIIRSDSNEVRFAAEADAVSSIAFVPDMLTMRAPETRRWLSMDIEGVDASRPLIIPRVHAKKPCPCGSGTPYAQCHRRWRRDIPRRHRVHVRSDILVRVNGNSTQISQDGRERRGFPDQHV